MLLNIANEAQKSSKIIKNILKKTKKVSLLNFIEKRRKRFEISIFFIIGNISKHGFDINSFSYS